MYLFEALGIAQSRRKEILDQYIPLYRETKHTSAVLLALQNDAKLSLIEKLYITLKIGGDKKGKKDDSVSKTPGEERIYINKDVYIEM